MTSGVTDLAVKLKYGEVLSLGFKTCKRFGLATARLTVVPAIWCLFALLFLYYFSIQPFFLTSHPNSLTSQILDSAIAMGVGLLVALPLYIIGLVWICVPAIQLTSKWICGEAIDIRQFETPSPKLVAKAVGVIALTWLVAGAPLLIGLGLLMAASAEAAGDISTLLATIAVVIILLEVLWVILYWSNMEMVVPIVLIEDLHFWKCIKRSRQLAKGKGKGQAPASLTAYSDISIIILNLIVFGGLSGILGSLGIDSLFHQMLGNSLPTEILIQAVNLAPLLLGIWFTAIIWSYCITFIYFHARFRLEGYDIELLARSVINRRGDQ